MPVDVRTVDGVSVVAMEGDVTFGGGALGRPLDLKGEVVDDVGATLRGLLEAGRPRILLDMRAVRFMDSAGIGELVALKKRAMERGGDVRLLAPPDRVRRLLEIVRLDRIFETFDEEQAGVASF